MGAQISRLPTAPNREVVNPRGLGVGHGLSRLPVEWEDHGGGANWHQTTVQRSPEMMIIGAIFKVLSDTQKERVRGYVRTMADMQMSLHAPAALAIVEKIA